MPPPPTGDPAAVTTLAASDLLEGLNPVQAQAVAHTEGPVLILAGAGSGKTRVLTHRIAHIVRNLGVSPWDVLALTFTNKAAQEMRARVGALVGESLGRAMWVCTFHSACVRILRRHADRLGYSRSFSIYDAADAQRLTALCLREANLDAKQYTPASVHATISRAKNEILSPAAFAEAAHTQRDKRVAEVYELYQRRLREANAMDFDDLLFRAVELLEGHDDVRAEYGERFRYVMVDEYQDTNHAQYRLCRLWASVHHNLCVVGDSDQSIYGFRGADIRNILEFERDEPDALVIPLEENYRSTQQILDAANALIANNARRHDKHLFTQRRGGELIVRYHAESEHDEAAFVATEVARLVDDEGRRNGDVAVFYRTNAQARVVEEVFVRAGLPYRVVGGTRFYDRREVKDVLAYLRLLLNPRDEMSLRRVINVPRRGIGDQTLRRLEAAPPVEGVGMADRQARPEDVTGHGPKARAALGGFGEILRELRHTLDADGLAATLEATWERTGYAAELRADGSIEAQGRLENLAELLSVVAEFQADVEAGDTPADVLGAFLEQASLVADTDELETYEDGVPETSVTLMTLHNAKGLEFPVVFVVGMEEGVFPHVRSLPEPESLEEERRLAYVGITRARERLYLCHAWARSLWGNTNYNTPSRFLTEIPAELLHTMGGEPAVRTWSRQRDTFRSRRGADRLGRDDHWARDDEHGPGLDLPDASSDGEPSGTTFGAGRTPQRDTGAAPLDLAPGHRVRHRSFGEGTVVSLSGAGERAVAVIRFDTKGEKKLVLAWAPLEKIG